jgi:hypothetical protein
LAELVGAELEPAACASASPTTSVGRWRSPQMATTGSSTAGGSS